MKTGRPIEDGGQAHQGRARTPRTSARARWAARTSSRRRSRRGPNLVYVGTNNMCMNYEGVEVKYTAGAPYVGANVLMMPGPRAVTWASSSPGIRPPARRSGASGAAARRGAAPWRRRADVVFYGTMDGWFKAVNAKTGELLWKHKLPSGTIGNPMTYRGSRRQAVRRDLRRSRRLVRASRGSRPAVQRPVRGVGCGERRLRVGPRQATTLGGSLHVFAIE